MSRTAQLNFKEIGDHLRILADRILAAAAELMCEAKDIIEQALNRQAGRDQSAHARKVWNRHKRTGTFDHPKIAEAIDDFIAAACGWRRVIPRTT